MWVYWDVFLLCSAYFLIGCEGDLQSGFIYLTSSIKCNLLMYKEYTLLGVAKK